MKIFFFYISEELTTKICEDLELKVPEKWGDFVSLWYGSHLSKSSEGWLVKSNKDNKDDLKKDVLHILENFEI